MPEFSLRATYATRAGRQGIRDVVRKADDITAAMRKFSAELERRGCTKIDIKAWAIANKEGITSA